MSRRRTLDRQLDQLQVTNEERQDAIKEFGAKESAYQRIRRQKMSIADFETVKARASRQRLWPGADPAVTQLAGERRRSSVCMQRSRACARPCHPASSPEHVRQVIGRGAFGEVRLCRRAIRDGGDGATASGEDELFAVKILRKKEMRAKDQIAHVRAERDLMRSAAGDNEWVVKLHFSFDDDEFLYLVMQVHLLDAPHRGAARTQLRTSRRVRPSDAYCAQFLPGGDLMTLLQREDVIPTDQSRFYVAEMVLALGSIHAMGYTHRDVKPDNWLLGRDGHLALTDFGLCKSFEETQAPNPPARTPLAPPRTRPRCPLPVQVAS